MLRLDSLKGAPSISKAFFFAMVEELYISPKLSPKQAVALRKKMHHLKLTPMSNVSHGLARSAVTKPTIVGKHTMQWLMLATRWLVPQFREMQWLPRQSHNAMVAP